MTNAVGNLCEMEIRDWDGVLGDGIWEVYIFIKSL